MGGDNLTSPIFFVCGTPSDRYGFECTALDGGRLPDRPVRYLDNIPTEKFPERGAATHFFCRDESEGWAIYAEYRSIHPNDAEHNRGAYIAVGCWSEAPLAPDQALDALFRIQTVHHDLAAMRLPDTDSFRADFRLSAYAAPPPSTAMDSGEIDQIRLADLFCQAAAGRGTYSGQSGTLLLTSKEIEQDSLAQLCTPAPMSGRRTTETAFPDPQSWHGRLLEMMREAANETPQTRQALRKLSKLEDERAKTIKSLTRIANDKLRRPPRGRAAPARTIGHTGRARTHSGAGDGWRLTAREIVFAALGTIIGIAVALAAFFGVRVMGL